MKLIHLLAATLLQGCSSLISGQISMPEGITIPEDGRVNITKLDSPNPLSAIVPISEDGGFEADGFGPGNYLVEILVPGFTLTSQKWKSGSEDDLVIPLGKKIASATTTFKYRSDVILDRGQGKVTITPPKY